MVVNKIKNMMCLVLIYILNCLPIKQHKIFFFSYYGNQYGCSPKYIAEYISYHYPKEKFDIVWAFNDMASKKHLAHIRKVKTMSLKYFYELCTSKVIITNFRTTNLYVKRKNQYYIQTWHSSLRLKQIEQDAAEALPQHYIKMAKNDSLKCDLLLSGCKRSTEIFRRAFWYAGEIFEHGTPRNDILFQDNSNKKLEVRNRVDIPKHSKILLYAPTFRKHNNLEVYDLDYEQIATTLTRKFGGEWTILVKLHPHLAPKSNEIIKGEQVHDVSAYDDMQELLLIADVLISDYSSLMFDFSITKRPCFLYIPDVKEYTKQDRKLYFDLSELPFISAVSNQKLCKRIEQFDEAHYQTQLNVFLNKVGTYEKGNAAAFITERLHSVCFHQKGSEMSEAV